MKNFSKPTHVANLEKDYLYNKGDALDITSVTLEIEELDMCTDFDLFEKRLCHSILEL